VGIFQKGQGILQGGRVANCVRCLNTLEEEDHLFYTCQFVTSVVDQIFKWFERWLSCRKTLFLFLIISSLPL